MINPANLLTSEIATSEQGSILTIPEIPEYDEDDYDLSDPKDLRKYLSDIENIVRRSFEYREFIRYIKQWYGMAESAEFENVNGENSGVRIEIHHTPFSLFDITSIVYEKRRFYHEDLSVFAVAKEIMELHYKFVIGLYPLSVTEHQLVHNGYLFIPTHYVFGHYDVFRSMYEQFIDEELLDTLEEIESYSRVSYDEEQSKRLISQSNVYLDTSGAYSLPVFEDLRLALQSRVDQIKSNGYMLPEFNEDHEYRKKEEKVPVYLEDSIYDPGENIVQGIIIEGLSFD